MTDIAVIDHGAGNLVSIAQALQRAGATVRIVEGPRDLEHTDAIVLPGVGATGATMDRLRQQSLVAPLQAWPKPMLGICVGLQLLFESSEEDGGACLGLIPGRVERLRAPRLPHIGWNELQQRSDDPLFSGIDPAATFYFVHSYAPVPNDPATVLAYTHYEHPIVAAVRSGNRVGVQFHPERSGRHGMQMIQNFVDAVAEGRRAA